MTDKQIFVEDINVPCKEQIIIDGVDVSECEFYVHYDYGKFPHGCSLHKDMFGLFVCCDVADCCKNCYFKQLNRKTAECEKLQEQISKIKEYIRHNMFDVDCENWFEIFIYTFEDWKKSILENENKYKQVLNEIEQHCNEQNLKYDTTACEILNIINKAKDTTNET